MIFLAWWSWILVIVAGSLLGVVIGRVIATRPHYINRMRPKVWMRAIKKMSRRDWLVLLAISLVLALVTYYLIEYSSVALEKVWAMYSPQEYVFQAIEESYPVLLAIIVLTVPIFEEWIFRGILLDEFSRRLRSRSVGVALSAFFFALFHLSNPGTYPAAVLPLFLGGVLFGICYLRVGLGGAIICHSTYNLIILLNEFYAIMPLPGIR